MLEKKEYYEIIIKDNNLALVYKIYYDRYNDFKNTFEYVYHTKNGDRYPLDKDLGKCIDILVVDDSYLYELLDDLREQGFCETIEFMFIDGYFNGSYNQYGQTF